MRDSEAEAVAGRVGLGGLCLCGRWHGPECAGRRQPFVSSLWILSWTW